VEYKFWIEKSQPFPTVEQELETLARQGEHLRRIIDPEKDDPIFTVATFLEGFDIRTAYPFLLFLLDSELTDGHWEEVSIALESYFLRRAVCGLEPARFVTALPLSGDLAGLLRANPGTWVVPGNERTRDVPEKRRWAERMSHCRRHPRSGTSGAAFPAPSESAGGADPPSARPEHESCLYNT